MATKKNKKIKRLKKKNKKLNARINKLKVTINRLKNTAESSDDSEPLFQSGSKFTQEEVELSGEMTDDAEAVLDLLDKS